ncbi:MAG: nucleotide sugar dehydrogenase [Rhodospirillales bacterium]
MKPVIGYAGMTHLGLNSAAAAAARGFDVVCFDPDPEQLAKIKAGDLPVVEPGLAEALAKHRNRLAFTAKADDLGRCDVIYVALDVATDDDGASDLSAVKALLATVATRARNDVVTVILSQVPPGFTREHAQAGRMLFYQVETLIFGQAVARALDPERIIVGCADPARPLPPPYRAFLDAFGCPILAMRYESAELAKIAVNCFLAAQISTANTLAELCERVDADWREIVPALRLDRRIGAHAYLKPGLGIAGGNLERDLATMIDLADSFGAPSGVVKAWVDNSNHRKLAAARILKERVLPGLTDPIVAVWGLAYKENINSLKNAPSLATIAALPDVAFQVHDPVVAADSLALANAVGKTDPLAAAKGADALLILTPWPIYASIAPAAVAKAMRGRAVIDPFGVLDAVAASEAGLDYHTLGASGDG